MKYQQLHREPIQMLWVGEALSRVEHLCLQSFIANGHPVHLYTYTPIDNVPKQVTCLDANHIIPDNKIFLHKGSYACFADWFRWKLLTEKGGYYCDTDMLCIKPFDFTEEVVLGYESYQKINIAALKFPVDDPLCKEMLACAEKPLKVRPYDPPKLIRKKRLNRFCYKKKAIGWGDTAGPPAISRAIKYLGLKTVIDLKNYTYFYPVASGNWDAFFDPNLSEQLIFNSTYAIHLWNEMLRRSDFDKNAPFPKGSLLDSYFQRYCSDYER